MDSTRIRQAILDIHDPGAPVGMEVTAHLVDRRLKKLRADVKGILLNFNERLEKLEMADKARIWTGV